jgi:hypothetical protein
MSEQINSSAPPAQGGAAPAATPASDLATIIGGEEIDVTYVAANQLDEALFAPVEKDKPAGRLVKFQPLLGTTERVKVRHVPLPVMRFYANAILSSDEATAIEIYCGKDQGWAELLDRASVNAIADKGLELNLDFFGAWYARQAKMKEKTTPQAIVDLQAKLAALEKTITEFRSSSSSTPTSDTTG